MCSCSWRAKSRREAIEVRWKEICEQHTANVLEWESQCKSLREAGVRAKDLPRKPKRQPKPKPTIPEEVDDQDGEEEEM